MSHSSLSSPRCPSTPPGVSTPRTPRTPAARLSTPRVRKTPGDRFIPNRAATDAQFSSYKVGRAARAENSGTPSSASSPSDVEGRRAMRERLLALRGCSSETRVLAFRQSAVSCSSAAKTPGKYQYWSAYSSSSSSCSSSSSSVTLSAKKRSRRIPKSAEKVLDAPNLMNDFYLNVLDWGKKGQIAVALGSTVYLLDTVSGGVNQLCSTETSSVYVSSLQWNKNGRYLAVGNSNSEVQLWDVNASKLVRRMQTHGSRVSSLAWGGRGGLLSAGAQSGHIHNYDARAAQFHVQSLESHTLDVCGLKWSPNGRFLASGGNDNLVNIWDTYSRDPWAVPAHSFKKHTAAVKALAWCPWQPNLLATGGGAADKCIKLWNACSGKMETSLDAGSQISGLLWSSTYQELLSSHGYPQNQLTIWRYNSPSSFSRLADLAGHEERVIHLTMSPDGQSVASAGADETLRLWKCFPSEHKSAKENQLEAMENSFPELSMYVR